jgi:glutamyl-tRNA synthetase
MLKKLNSPIFCVRQAFRKKYLWVMNFELTRIAPTPSGYLHLGNAYSFLLTKALAQKHGAKILLRIDDLDRDRYRSEYVQDIFDTLDFLEIQIDQGPKNLLEMESTWSQVHRLPIYTEALEQLKQKRLTFACTCTRAQILQIDPTGVYLGQCLDRRFSLEREQVAWRINTLDADFLQFQEYPKQAKSSILPEEATCYVVRKKDGLPAYQLCSLIDDLHFGVDLIVRGQDLYPSTLAQLDLARLLGKDTFAQNTFFHHPLLKSLDQRKLSKSAGSNSIKTLREEGKTLAGLFLLLGKSLGLKEELRSFEDFNLSLAL